MVFMFIMQNPKPQKKKLLSKTFSIKGVLPHTVRERLSSSHNEIQRIKHSDQEASLEQEESERGVDSWSTSFEKLLEDPAGLHTFAEFLKKEFSRENIYFWVACEKYRELQDENERKKAARDIFDKHLCLGAPEPVNVDSHARQETQEGLEEASKNLFMQAQKQIFNLMKFDSYPRFIKSELYKECLVRHISGEELPFPGGEELDIGLQLHNHKGDNTTKSHNKSVTSGELPEQESCSLCRVILPGGATTVVQTRKNESVRDLVIRLLDKRGLHFSAFDVFAGNSPKAVSLDEDSTVLGSKEVRVEQLVVFRLDLPNRKTVGVKAKSCRTLGEALRPILHKYGYKLELVTLCLMSENEVLELGLPVTAVDNQRLQVLTRSLEAWKNETVHKPKTGPTLDEITNRVFEELLQGKTEAGRNLSDQGSIRSEDWGSEHSSGIFSRFLRRDSALLDKARESRAKNKKVSNASKPPTEDTEGKPTGITKPPLIAKWKVGVKLQGRSESDELYEGLKRAQRSRLEDQRGTEINFELPDFLKDKENAPQAGKKIRKLRRGEESNAKFCEASDLNGQSQAIASSHESLVLGAGSNKYRSDKDTTTNLVSRYLDTSFSSEGIIASPRQAEEYFLSRPASALVDYGISRESGKTTALRPMSEKILSSSVSKSSESNGNSSLENTVIETGLLNGTLTCESTNDLTSVRPRQLSDPPPLPPKPKHLPAKASLWGASNPPAFRTSSEISSNTRFARPSDVKRDNRVCRSRRAVYLDQPSSSFV